MFSIEDYLSGFSAALRGAFAERLLYIGLQGSYSRGEADEKSDIDVMVVLDTLSVSDLDRYRSIVEQTGEAARSCGFLCGREELSKWNPCEICHLLHTTEDWYGSLSALVPSYTDEDVRIFVKIRLGNLYHALCHGYVHAQREAFCAALPDAYKNVFFILQNVYYRKTGVFFRTKEELLMELSASDRKVMEQAQAMRRGEPWDFPSSFSLLLQWCRNILCEIGES